MIFCYFHQFETRKERTYLSAWWLFSPNKTTWPWEWTYFSIFSYFHEFETKEQWTYCPICGYFHELESKKVGYFDEFKD